MGRRDAAPYSYERACSVFLFVVLSIAGCKCSEPKPSADAVRQEDLARLPQASGSMQDQLNVEAGGRPTDTVTFEALSAALAKDGITFGASKQTYGKKLLAHYCATADSTDGMIVTVCEYPSADQAARGQTEGDTINKATAGHQSRLRKKSVLHLVARSDTPPEHVAKVLSTFEGL